MLLFVLIPFWIWNTIIDDKYVNAALVWLFGLLFLVYAISCIFVLIGYLSLLFTSKVFDD